MADSSPQDKSLLQAIQTANATKRTDDGGQWVSDKEHWSAPSSTVPSDGVMSDKEIIARLRALSEISPDKLGTEQHRPWRVACKEGADRLESLLSAIAALHQIVVGALRDNVNAHGNVVEDSWIGSAAKRIVSQIEKRSK